MTRAKTLDLLAWCHIRDAREDKTRPHQSARNLSFRQCFRPRKGLLVQSAGRENVIVAGSEMALFFSKRSRTFYRNTIDVMGGCAGRHLGGPRSPPGGCKKLEETRREVLQRSSLASPRLPIHHSTHNLSESRESCGFS